MPGSPKLDGPLPEVETYQLWIEENGLRLLSPHSGFDGTNYKIKSDPTSLSYRTMLAMFEMLRVNRLNEKERQLFGEYLYDILLDNAAGEILHAAVRKEPHTILRVELHFTNAPNLAALPWEYLYRSSEKSGGANGYFLAMQERLALVRCPRVPAVNRSLRIAAGQKVKVLLVACSPANLAQLEFKQFVESMKALPDVELQALITYKLNPTMALAQQLKPEATFDNFEEAMGAKPDIVHFLGHGKVDANGGSVAFVDSAYEADWRSSEKLKEVFQESSVRLTFLQACETSVMGDTSIAYRALSSVAGALADTGVPAIVAMQAQIEIGDASSFASVFYRSIVQERLPLFRAMQRARQKARGAACIPVLFLRYDGRDKQPDVLFEELPPGGVVHGSTVSVSSGKCPWCYSGLESEQMEGDVCPYCESDLRCASCNSRLKGTIPKERNFVICQTRLCRGRLRRYVESQGSGWQEKPSTGAVVDKMSGQTVGGEQQQDVFQ